MQTTYLLFFLKRILFSKYYYIILVFLTVAYDNFATNLTTPNEYKHNNTIQLFPVLPSYLSSDSAFNSYNKKYDFLINKYHKSPTLLLNYRLGQNCIKIAYQTKQLNSRKIIELYLQRIDLVLDNLELIKSNFDGGDLSSDSIAIIIEPWLINSHSFSKEFYFINKNIYNSVLKKTLYCQKIFSQQENVRSKDFFILYKKFNYDHFDHLYYDSDTSSFFDDINNLISSIDTIKYNKMKGYKFETDSSKNELLVYIYFELGQRYHYLNADQKAMNYYYKCFLLSKKTNNTKFVYNCLSILLTSKEKKYISLFDSLINTTHKEYLHMNKIIPVYKKFILFNDYDSVIYLGKQLLSEKFYRERKFYFLYSLIGKSYFYTNNMDSAHKYLNTVYQKHTKDKNLVSQTDILYFLSVINPEKYSKLYIDYQDSLAKIRYNLYEHILESSKSHSLNINKMNTYNYSLILAVMTYLILIIFRLSRSLMRKEKVTFRRIFKISNPILSFILINLASSIYTEGSGNLIIQNIKLFISLHYWRSQTYEDFLKLIITTALIFIISNFIENYKKWIDKLKKIRLHI